MKMKFRKLIFYTGMFFLIVFSTLLLSEVLLRLSGRVAVQGLHTASEKIFDKIPGIFEPGQNFIYRKKHNLPFHVSINSLGYRGPEISRKKPSGVIRILCLGDSTTFGDFVDDEETFPYRLQKLFEQKQEPVEVINGGVGGTTIVDQLYFLKKSMEIDPDIVILTFFQNDISDLNRIEPLYISFAKNRRLKSSGLFGYIYRLFRDTALFQLALKARAKFKVYFHQRRQKNRLKFRHYLL